MGLWRQLRRAAGGFCRVGPGHEHRVHQLERLARTKQSRDNGAVANSLEKLKQAAKAQRRRLSERSRQLLRDAGLKLSESGNNPLTARAENFPLDLMFVRDDDIPTFVGDGVCELGIVGQNVLEEYALAHPGKRIEEVARLGFGRCSLKIAAPDSLNFFQLKMLDGQRIATSYPRLLARFLERHGLAAEIVTMRGAVELAPRLGIARFVCDLVSTGATLAAVDGSAAVRRGRRSACAGHRGTTLGARRTRPGA